MFAGVAKNQIPVAAARLGHIQALSGDDDMQDFHRSTRSVRAAKVNKVKASKHKLQRITTKTDHAHNELDGGAVQGDGVNNNGEDGSEAEDNDDDDENPEVIAPSDGGDTTKPRLHVNIVSSESMNLDADNRQTGPISGTLAVPFTTKKRTLSNTSILTFDGIDGVKDNVDFPRKKIDLKLSNTDCGLWKYSENEANALRALAAEMEAENAVTSEDDDDEIYLKVDQIEDSDSELDDSKLEDEEAKVASADDQTKATKNKASTGSDDEDDMESEDEFWMNERISTFFGNNILGPADDMFQSSALFEQAPDSDPAVPSFMRRKSEASERRVRFDDNVVVKFSSASSSSESEFDFNTFPDLLDDYARSPFEKSPFKPLDEMHNSIREQIRAPDDEEYFCAADSDATTSEFDFGEREAAQHMFSNHTTGVVNSPETVNSDEDESASLSGYDCKWYINRVFDVAKYCHSRR